MDFTQEELELLEPILEALENYDSENEFETIEELVEAFGEAEQLDEVSKKLLGRYIKGASRDYAENRAMSFIAKDPKRQQDYSEKSSRRRKGIDKAVKKLTKESIDNLVQNALEDKPAEFLTSFEDAMQELIADRIAHKKIEMQQAMFGEPVTTEEEVDLEEGKSRDSDMNRDKFRKFRARDEKRGEKKKDRDGDMDEETVYIEAFEEFLGENEFESLEEAFEAFCEAEQLDEISGKTLGSYIQKARGDIEKKVKYRQELENNPSVKRWSDRRSDYYKRREYDSRGKSIHRDKIETSYRREKEAKEKLDPNYLKNTDAGKRRRGIDQAVKKLQYGKLT